MSTASEVALFEDELRLSDAEQRLLDHLHDEADSTTGVVHGFTFTRCSQELGLGRAAGRRTMGPWLQRLADLSLVEILTYPLGRRPGTVRINRAKPRETARSNRAVDAWQPRADELQPRAATARPRECHKEQDLKLVVEVQKLASEPAREIEIDWTDDDLDELLEPLLAYCRRCSPPLPGLTGRAGALAALRRYRRDQIVRAVALAVTEVRAGRIARPVGLLIAMAKAGSPEYFPADQPSTQAAPGPDPGGHARPFDPAVGRRGLAAARAGL